MSEMSNGKRVCIIIVCFLVAVGFYTFGFMVGGGWEDKATVPATQAQSDVAEKQVNRLYVDNGQGVMIITKRWKLAEMNEIYLQWKTDYPDRAHKTIACAINPSHEFILLYQTK